MVLDKNMRTASMWPTLLWPSPSLDATQCRHHDWRKRRRSSSTTTISRPSDRISRYSRRKSFSCNFFTILSLCMIMMLTCCAHALILEPSIQTVGAGGTGGGSPISDDGLNFNMENKIAAIFSRVSYGSTTTKRSISDSVVQSSLTTIPTPFLTTYR